jgi:hypothetical protein
MLSASAGTEVGGKPTATTDASAGAADEAGRRGRGGTPSGTWDEHCRTELPQPSSSLLPCGCGSSSNFTSSIFSILTI